MLKKAGDLARRLADSARALRARIAPTPERCAALEQALGGPVAPEQVPDCVAQAFANASFATRVLQTEPLGALARCLAALEADPRCRVLTRRIAGHLDSADLGAILAEFRENGGRTDPVVHFYELFLEAYDPAERRALGAYYTPAPVVSYIQRSADRLLRDALGLAEGLSDPRALALDPACGTGAFLAGAAPILGFELSPAACAVANLSLALRGSPARARVTGSLDESLAIARALLAQAPGRVPAVLGNPPYSRASGTRPGEVESLLESYKAAVRGARNLQPLSDDYIRFVRFAQALIEERGSGVAAMITSSSFLNGRVHRGMREELLRAYSELYVLDLHGSAKMESAPAGDDRDENVFDIQQGVCITLLLRRPGFRGQGRVFHAALAGSRESKLAALGRTDVADTAWREIEPEGPMRFFAGRESASQELEGEYLPGIALNELFDRGFTGVGTGRDEVFVAFERAPVEALGRDLLNPALSDSAFLRRHGLKDTESWNLSRRRRALEGKRRAQVVPYRYRPFDTRYVLYEPLLRRDQRRNMSLLLERGNLALLACQQQSTREFSHVFCTDGLTDESILSNRTRERAYLFPLRGEGGFNLRAEALARLSAACGSEIQAEDAFYYACAILHSPGYRRRYREYLRTDFPRIPLVRDPALLRELAEIGRNIARLELQPQAPTAADAPRLAGKGDRRIERVRPDPAAGAIAINSGQRIEGIPAAALNARVGAYAVCEKWLKDRRGQRLSEDLLAQFRALSSSLETIAELAARIDASISNHGDWAAIQRMPSRRQAA